MIAPRDVAECIILDLKNRILLQKKTFDYPNCPPGYWCFFGGEIKQDENPEQAIRREISEEIGIKLEQIKLIKIREYRLENGKFGKAYTFVSRLNLLPREIILKEGAGFAFFEEKEIENISIAESNLELIKDFFKIK